MAGAPGARDCHLLRPEKNLLQAYFARCGAFSSRPRVSGGEVKITTERTSTAPTAASCCAWWTLVGMDCANRGYILEALGGAEEP